MRLKVILNMAVVQDFLRSVESQLHLDRFSSLPLPARSQLVVSAKSVAGPLSRSKLYRKRIDVDGCLFRLF